MRPVNRVLRWTATACADDGQCLATLPTLGALPMPASLTGPFLEQFCTGDVARAALGDTVPHACTRAALAVSSLAQWATTPTVDGDPLPYLAAMVCARHRGAWCAQGRTLPDLLAVSRAWAPRAQADPGAFCGLAACDRQLAYAATRYARRQGGDDDDDDALVERLALTCATNDAGQLCGAFLAQLPQEVRVPACDPGRGAHCSAACAQRTCVVCACGTPRRLGNVCADRRLLGAEVHDALAMLDGGCCAVAAVLDAFPAGFDDDNRTRAYLAGACRAAADARALQRCGRPAPPALDLLVPIVNLSPAWAASNAGLVCAQVARQVGRLTALPPSSLSCAMTVGGDVAVVRLAVVGPGDVTTAGGILDAINGAYMNALLLQDLPAEAYVDGTTLVAFGTAVQANDGTGVNVDRSDEMGPDASARTVQALLTLAALVGVVLGLGAVIAAGRAVKRTRWQARRGQILDLVGQIDQDSVDERRGPDRHDDNDDDMGSSVVLAQ